MNLPIRSQRAMTIRELAEYWQVSERTIKRLIDAGKLRAFKIGRQWRVHQRDVERFE